MAEHQNRCMFRHLATSATPFLSGAAAVVFPRFGTSELPTSGVPALAVGAAVASYRMTATMPAREKISAEAVLPRSPELLLAVTFRCSNTTLTGGSALFFSRFWQYHLAST